MWTQRYLKRLSKKLENDAKKTSKLETRIFEIVSYWDKIKDFIHQNSADDYNAEIDQDQIGLIKYGCKIVSIATDPTVNIL